MFSSQTYKQRRDTLRGMLSGGVALFVGSVDAPANALSNTYRYRQNSNFLYYFGLDMPDLVAVVDVDSGEDIIFGNDLTISDLIWTGPQPTIAELAARVGVTITKPLSELPEYIARAQAQGRKIHATQPYRAETAATLIALNVTEGIPSEELVRASVAMRSIKSAEEIAEMELACDIGYKMHMKAFEMCREGENERRIVGAIEGIALQEGWGVSFLSIVSQHGETLHNRNCDGTLQNGRLLLVDAGAEALSNYTSDFTRTMPVSGKFTQKQKDVYNIVLAANNHVFDISKPGLPYRDAHLAATRIILDGMKQLGAVRGNVDDALQAGAAYLFMPHGLGHMMGLDDHDMDELGEKYVGYDDEIQRSEHPSCKACRMARRLQPGMVVSVEPGIYFIPALIDKWRAEGICKEFINFDVLDGYKDFGGIRLEDDMLITPEGNRMLGTRLPITVDEVEAVMKR